MRTFDLEYTYLEQEQEEDFTSLVWQKAAFLASQSVWRAQPMRRQEKIKEEEEEEEATVVLSKLASNGSNKKDRIHPNIHRRPS